MPTKRASNANPGPQREKQSKKPGTRSRPEPAPKTQPKAKPKAKPKVKPKVKPKTQPKASLSPGPLDTLALLSRLPVWEWPGDAERCLRAVLEDERVALPMRRLAAELAGEPAVMGDSLAELLLSLVERADLDASLRETAALALGPSLELCELDGWDLPEDPDGAPFSEPVFQRVLEALRQVYHRADAPGSVRRAALMASARAPQGWHTGAVRAAFAQTDLDWRRAAAAAAEHVRGFERQILEALSDPDPGLRQLAVSAAGAWELPEAWEPVAALLASPGVPRPLLLAAIEASSSLCPENLFAHLEVHLDSRDEEIADAAREAMAMTEDLDFAEDDLLDASEDDGWDDLGESDDEDDLPF
jgi:hypothetical protein